LVSATEVLKQNSTLNKLYFIALFFASFSVFGQDDQLYDHRLNEKKWEDIRDGIRYEGRDKGSGGRRWTYDSDQEFERDRRRNGNGSGGYGSGGSGDGGGYGDGSGNRDNGAPDRQSTQRQTPPSQRSSSSSNFSMSGGLGPFGYILLILFAGVLIYLIYRLFINAERKGAKIKHETFDLEELNPSEIPLTELQRLLLEALAKQDYRGAVRIYFIFIVRGLVQKNAISWKKEKTNFHYLIEMSGKSEYDDFNTSVSYFEIIWYGKREIDASKFEQIRPVFTQFLDKLGIK